MKINNKLTVTRFFKMVLIKTTDGAGADLKSGSECRHVSRITTFLF